LARPASYESVASILPYSSRRALALSNLTAQFGLAVPTEDSEGPHFYADLIGSTAVLAPLVDSVFSVKGGRSGTVADFYKIHAPPALREETVLRRLRRDVRAEVLPRSGLVRISVRAPDPHLAFQLNNAVIALVNRFNLHVRQARAEAERRFTGTRLAEASRDMEAAEARLRDFYQRNRTWEGSAELTFQREGLVRDVSIRQQLYLKLAEAFEQARIEEVRNTPVVSVVEQPRVPVRPEGPMLPLKVFGAFVAGLFLAAIVAVLRDSVGRPRTAWQEDVDELQRFRHAGWRRLTTRPAVFHGDPDRPDRPSSE
jgi:uncharacterized protein involved in exopolysaccharide biosynthesis